MLTLIFGCNHAFSEQGLFSYLGRDIWLITANQDANFDVSKVRFFFCYLSKEGIFFPKPYWEDTLIFTLLSLGKENKEL